jgi:uncharacterized protein (TIGR00369 family)
MSTPRNEAIVHWHDATQVLPRILALDGLGYVQAVAAGELPCDPLMEVLGIRVTEVERGRVVTTAEPQPQHMNLGGIAHGGYLSTILDCTSGFALHSTLEPGHSAPHVQVSYQFVRVAPPGSVLRCEATVRRSGRRLGQVEARLTDAAGRLIAAGETTNAVLALGEVSELRSPGPAN